MSSSVVVAPVSALTWTEVEPGFHVASRGGEFGGYVERTGDGSFVAFDEYSTPVGRYATLTAARRSLATTDTPRNRRRRDRVRRVRQTAALAAGTVAGMLLLTASVLAPQL